MSWDYGIGVVLVDVVVVEEEDAEEARAMCVCDTTQKKLRIRELRLGSASSQKPKSFFLPLFFYYPFNLLIFTKNYFSFFYYITFVTIFR